MVVANRKLTDEDIAAARTLVRAGSASLREAAADLGVSHSTLAARIRKLDAAEAEAEARARLREQERRHFRRHGATKPDARAAPGGRPEDQDTTGPVTLVEVTDPVTGQKAIGLTREEASAVLYQRGGTPPPKPLPPTEDGRPRGDAPFVWRDASSPARSPSASNNGSPPRSSSTPECMAA